MAQRRKPYQGNGKRLPTDDIDDPSSQTGEEHILVRCKRYFKLLARIHAIKELTGLEYIVQGGASTVQDAQGSREFPACHVLRVGEVNPELKDKNEELYNALRNFIGHTQIESADLNYYYGGIGGAIDRYQSANLKQLDGMRYEGEYGMHEKTMLLNMLYNMLTITTAYPEHAAEAKSWILLHMKEPGLTRLYKYMKSSYDGVKNGEFVKIWKTKVVYQIEVKTVYRSKR